MSNDACQIRALCGTQLHLGGSVHWRLHREPKSRHPIDSPSAIISRYLHASVWSIILVAVCDRHLDDDPPVSLVSRTQSPLLERRGRHAIWKTLIGATIRIESIPALDRMDQLQPGNEEVYPHVWVRCRGIGENPRRKRENEEKAKEVLKTVQKLSSTQSLGIGVSFQFT